MKRRFCEVLILSIIILAVGACAGKLPTEPTLRIETGMHSAPITRIGVDVGNRYLVTGSNDKTVRVWELATGRLLQTLRPPIGGVDEGKIYAVALSPDGRTVAAAGWTGYEWGWNVSIYFFDRASGRMIKKMSGLPRVISNLTYSRNGRYIVAGLLSKKGIRVYRTTDYRLVLKDRDYGDSCYGADFDKTGRLVTTSWDGYVRLYANDFKLITKEEAPDGKRPHGVRFSPDGAKVAVGFTDSTKVDVLSGKDLSYLHSPDTDDITSGDMPAVSWSQNGRYLYAGGKASKLMNGEWKTIIRKWLNGGKGGYVDLPAAENTIMQIIPLRSGGIVFGSANPAFGVFDASDRLAVYKGPAIANLSGNRKGFLVSDDGSTVQFSYDIFGKSPARFSVSERLLELNPDPSDSQNLNPPVTSTTDLSITNWASTYHPKLNGRALKLEQHEFSRSLAVSPGGKTFLLGTGWYLCLFDGEGTEIWKVSIPDSAGAVNVSGDGKVAVAAIADGTIRWYRMKDGKEILALFPHKDRKRWVLWTPSGYYDAAPGAEELIGWHVNNGKDAAADFFPASRFRAVYYRPDVVAKVIVTLDEREAVRLADEESGRKKQAVAVREMLPPVVTIVSPADGAEVSIPEVTVKFSVRTPSGEPVTAVKALVDGRPAAAERGVKIVGREGDVHELRVTIPERDAEIAVIAENRYAASEPATVRVRWKGAPREEFAVKPRLYVLAVGVSNYADKSLRLSFAAKDARDFAAVMERQKGRLYRDVAVKVMTDEGATKDEILDGLDWLQKETTSKDVAMVFLAGHGVNDPSGVYYFLPVNADTDRLKRTGVAFSDIKNTVASLAGKAVVFVDTCHAGSVMGARRGMADITAVVNELASAENGAVVFASSTGRQYALEDAAWGNGAFTRALVEGIGGKADYTGKGKITVNMLDLYLSERVKELTKGRQTPTTTKPHTVPDFPIAVTR
ncbi:MAG: caspase family protein [Syntrophobacterales bacterium]|nr:caspase family protein [Syntrophobacterales bacterium]